MSEPNRIPSLPQTIDPFASCRPGRYDDYLVSVVRGEQPRDGAEDPGPVVRTEHFRMTERGRRIEVTHWLRPDQLDNDVAGLLAEELFVPGWLSGAEVFERVFTGVVRSCIDDPLLAWGTFYGNTLARIRQCWRAPDTANGPGHDDDQWLRARVCARPAAHSLPARSSMSAPATASSRCCWPSGRPTR